MLKKKEFNKKEPLTQVLENGHHLSFHKSSNMA